MPGSTPSLAYQFNVEAVRARSMEDLERQLVQAEIRLREAERAREAAELDRARLSEALDAVTSDRDAQLVAKEVLWKEKKSLENEVEVLFKRISELVHQLSTATSVDLQERFALEIKTLQRRLDDRNQTLFGTRSERRGAPAGETVEEKEVTPPRRKRTGSKRTAQPKLPMTKLPHRLTPEARAHGCVKCAGNLAEMKGQTEDYEEVTVQRTCYKLVVHQCQKYRCEDCGWIDTAPGPDRVIPGGRYSAEFAVHSIVQKYVDHMPLDRQVRQMERAGLQVTSQTLWDQHRYVGLLLLPTFLALHALILSAEVCFADESPWRLMTRGGSKKWWVWVLSNGLLVYYQIVSSRGAAAARELLRDFAGILMSDDYTVYSALEQERTRLGGVQTVIDEDGKVVELPTPNYTLATCWMHARRYLVKAEKYHPEAGPALDLIAGLYHVEAQAEADVDRQAATASERGEPLSEDATKKLLLTTRAGLRERISKGLVDRIDEWRKRVVRLPGTALAEALDHMDRVWSRLILFLSDPRIPLDNGHAERQIRDVVLGRRNFQGSRSDEGARVSATFYSLLRSARNLGLDPEAYLLEAVRQVLAKPKTVFLPTDYVAMLQKKPSQQTE